MRISSLSKSWPLGVTETTYGWNFVTYSGDAHAVDVCFYDRKNLNQEIAKFRLPFKTGDYFHGCISGLESAQPYGFRVYGPWSPDKGHYYNPNKLLLDPWSLAVSSEYKGHVSQRTATLSCSGNLILDETDSSENVPRSLMMSMPSSTSSYARLSSRQSDADLIIYELHIKGFTALNSNLPKKIRGTFAGLGHELSIQYLLSLGVNTVQLMPVQLRADDLFLRQKNLSNYWGYQTVCFLVPDPRFSSVGGNEGCIEEFQQMVTSLHQAGINVILDVVYNHTAEHGSSSGYSMSLRGFDNKSFYRNGSQDESTDIDYTGTGNTLDITHSVTLRLVMDSMRYWMEHMGVDGFRFDLATTLGRNCTGMFDPQSVFFKTVSQDPVLSRAILIAEPWDLGPDGYQLGGFPGNWKELNGKFRDVVRRFWKGDRGVLREFASKITGSEDTYSAKNPVSSVNFITSHDGFTLHDLVSFNNKHNHANGEDNRDGDDHNMSWNCGTEGKTDRLDILALRDRQKKNFLVTTMLSHGIPFILMGDEKGRTQLGNNNGYCQDSEAFWMAWMDETSNELLDFVKALVRIRQSHSTFRRKQFLSGEGIYASKTRDAVWQNEKGQHMQESQWLEDERRHIGLMLSGIPSEVMRGNQKLGAAGAFLLLFSAEDREIQYILMGDPNTVIWQVIVDTQALGHSTESLNLRAGNTVTLLPKHVIVLKLVKGSLHEAQKSN